MRLAILSVLAVLMLGLCGFVTFLAMKGLVASHRDSGVKWGGYNWLSNWLNERGTDQMPPPDSQKQEPGGPESTCRTRLIQKTYRQLRPNFEEVADP
jgi:hypothetical protein